MDRILAQYWQAPVIVRQAPVIVPVPVYIHVYWTDSFVKKLPKTLRDSLRTLFCCRGRLGIMYRTPVPPDSRYRHIDHFCKSQSLKMRSFFKESCPDRSWRARCFLRRRRNFSRLARIGEWRHEQIDPIWSILGESKCDPYCCKIEITWFWRVLKTLTTTQELKISKPKDLGQ